VVDGDRPRTNTNPHGWKCGGQTGSQQRFHQGV